MSGSKLWSLIRQTVQEWSQDKAMRLAAATALYTILALAPLLVVAVTLISFIYGAEAQHMLSSRAGGVVGSAGKRAIVDMIASSSKQRTGGVIWAIISFIVALVSASGLFVSLQDAMNTIWNVGPRPDAGWTATIRSRLISAAMVIVAAILLFASLILSATLSSLMHELGGWITGLSFVGDLIVSFAIITILFAMVYKFLPDAKIDWSDVWLGAALTAALFIIGKYLLTVYFRFASVGSAYGAAGSLAALLLWIYYSAMIVFFGAEFTQVYAASEGKPLIPNEYAVKLTADDRAHQGIPTEADLRAAAARSQHRPPDARRKTAAASAPRPAIVPLPTTIRKSGSTDQKQYTTAAVGAALGAIVSGVTVRLAMRRRDPVAAMRLDHRMARVESHFGGISRMQDHLRDRNVRNRIADIEQRIRHATTELRARETGRPRWMVRLAQWLVGQ